MDSDDEFDQWEQQWERERDDQEFMPGYEEAQSRLRLSMTCNDMVSNKPLEICIIELAALKTRGSVKSV